MNEHPGLAAVRAATYRKSSRSSGAQVCVAIGFAAGWVGVRDTKEDHHILVLPAAPFTAFLASLQIVDR
ncbi:MAG TPA: DUF397 domain-containing protein [Pseudonocardiaceae bacterium]|jgi:hypothetical protein|nr:DUF397 domain-containing protein [Pseudonocardiaceae bacterium]